MSNLGMGVMIQMLGGNEETLAALEQSIGKPIGGITMQDDTLRIEMEDGRTLTLEDAGQSCCEHRFMTCDDDLTGFGGATLVSVETRDAPDMEDGYGEHEVQFLVVTTSKGTVTAATHNEHNGYYGGFWIQARLIGDPR